MAVEQINVLNGFKYAWLIPVLPLLSFAIVALFVRQVSQIWSGIIATIAVFVSFLLTALLCFEYFNFPTHPTLIPWELDWLRYKEGLGVKLGILLDPLSLLLMLVVTLVSFLVHLFSLSYMKGDPGYGRYFAFLGLFTASMLGLVVAPNLLQMFVCWELVGLSSFLLIGYYFHKPEAVAAAKKAFIVTRFADLGFFLAVLILAAYGYRFFEVGGGMPGLEPFDFLFLTSSDFIYHLAAHESFLPGVNMLTLTALLLFLGAAGKSAMFPLHIWLPDAMEGPTPVSALIHAATMVVAGVYLVARMFALFLVSPFALEVILVVGTTTCLLAALVGCVQNDLKRVLAFSTLSQLGYMMLALGVSSEGQTLGYSASLFHLFTHAFFKALLFLSAGAVIHAVHSNNIWDMGGLARRMPITNLAFLIAALALAGVFPFSGFFSKDLILLAALESGHYLTFAVALAVAGLTAFYIARVYFVCFWEIPASKAAEEAHEAPILMLVSLVLLALLAVVAGYSGVEKLVYFSALGTNGDAETFVAVLGTIMAAVGVISAYVLYLKQEDLRARLVARMSRLYIILRQKYYFDEVYLFITKRIVFRFIARPAAWFDRNVVDGLVNVCGWTTRVAGGLLGFVQTGQVQTYMLWTVVGALVLFILVL